MRPARRGDLPEVQSLLRELGYASGSDTTTFAWVLSHPEMEVMVATDAMDRPVGLLTMSHRPQLRLSGRIATIDELVVAEAWRAKGVGKELLGRAVARARALGVKRIELNTHRGRESYSREFYRKNGFAEADSAILRIEVGEKKK